MIHDDEDNDENDATEITEIGLQYAIYSDDDNRSIYVKFNGFNSESEMNDFSEYIEKQLTLLLFTSKTLH